MNKECNVCKVILPLEDFRPVGRPCLIKPIAYVDTCSFCRKTKNINAYQKRKRKEFRRIVFDHYGWICACCKETEPAFLSLDHINGGGTKESKDPLKMYRSIITQNFPSTYQILCMNCNWAKGRYGVCPHKQM